MTAELENFLANSFKLRKTLEQCMPKEAVDYIMILIAKDGAHRKLVENISENSN